MPSILVIDDDSTLRLLLCEVLKKAGYLVHEAANGKEGVKMFNSRPADLVITDIVMPEQDGLETIMALRLDHPSTPLIAMSGGGKLNVDYLPMAKQLGAQRTLAKPFGREQLLSMVREVLEHAA